MKELRFEDPRSTLERMRRVHLRKYLQYHNVPCDPDAPAITMRALAIDRGLNGSDWLEVVAKIEAEKTEAKQDEQADYQSMTIQQLRTTCKDRGIKISPSDNSEALREKLNGNAS